MASGRVHRWVTRWPLRTQIVALLMGLVAVGLLVAGLVAAAALRGYLYTQVDTSLTRIAADMTDPDRPERQLPPGPAPSGPGPVGQESNYVAYLDPAGATLSTLTGTDSDPPTLPTLTTAEVAAREGEPFVVDSESGSTRWRVLAVSQPDGSGSVAVAQDIGGIDATVSRLILIEVAIGVAVLVLLALAGRLLIRRSLRPLLGVERAAASIAAGDLSTRAPGADPRTEVGSLATSFNTMADNVEAAFAAQRASESTARSSAATARASEVRMRQFVADASHELRTPLTSVRGFAELYRIGAVAPGPPLDDAMGRIEAEAARMGLLVDDLLLLARLDQQRPLERATVDLVTVVTDAVVAARAAAGAREVRLTRDPHCEPPKVLGDAARLRQVLDNLLSNALRYSPADQPVTVSLGHGDPGWAALEVSDHGEGMPADVAGRAFERFYRADRARSREQGGSGLGLAIVAAIVAAHEGSVQLDTQQGRGTTVRVLLPTGRTPVTVDRRGGAPADA
ncbi:MAG: HAMP domain-containing sensor histidine kinase [Candidatus Nanopelagicales bacterium]